MEDMESLLIPQISMDVDDTPLNLEEGNYNADETSATTDSDNEENIQMRLRNLLELENFDPAQTPEKLTETELESKERIFSEGHPPIEYVRMHCSSCNCHLGTAPLNQDNRYIHPLLNVLVCKNCYEFYCSGDFEKDEDGSELYCRWCGQGGKVMCCSGCAFVFCQRCVRQNLGKRTLDLIIESDDWYCFACNPSQLVNLRILCATLFDYVKQEISEVKQSGDIDRLKRDFSMCCSNKSAQQKYSMPVRKRRRVPSEDQTYHPSLDKDLMESRRSNNMLKKALNSSASIMNVNKPLPPLQKGVLQSPPPLVGISGSNTINIRFNQSTPNQRTSTITTNMRGFPAIQPRPTILNSGVRPQLSAKPVQLLCATNNRPITSNTVSNMAASLNNQLTNAARGSQNFIPLNNTTNAAQGNIVRVTNHNPQQNRRVSSLPTHFPPGIRNNWFNQAATITSTIVARLSTSLVDLSNEQANATSVEQLATVHNKLQELLSSSVNSMIQVRKNLRNEFLNDLNKMKFTAVPKQQQKTTVVARANNKIMNSQPVVVDDDDDVIIVNNEEEDPLAITTAPSVDTTVNLVSPEVKVKEIMTSKIVPGPGIKIKVKTDLFKEESAITNGKPIEFPNKIEEVNVNEPEDIKPDISIILDDSVDGDNTPAAKTPAEVSDKTPAEVSDNKTPAEESDKKPAEVSDKTPAEASEETPAEAKSDDLANVDKETYLQIQHALAESKLEALIEENSKYKVDTSEICPEELAKILTVRVVLTTNFSPYNCTRKRRRIKQEVEVDSPTKLSASVDFEEILHGNLINTEQAKPHFEQAFSSFVEQTKSSEGNLNLDEELPEDDPPNKPNGEAIENEQDDVEMEEVPFARKEAESDLENEDEEEEIPEEIVEETSEKAILDSSDDKMQTEQIGVR